MAPQTPQTLELTSFRRTFALLILLVVLPSAGLSGFGVVAIINQRAAVEKSLEAAWSGRLFEVPGKLGEALDAAVIDRGQRVRVIADGRELTDVGFSME